MTKIGWVLSLAYFFTFFHSGFCQERIGDSPLQDLSPELQIDTLYTKARSLYENNDFGAAQRIYLSIDSIAQINSVVNATVVRAILDRSEISRTTFTYEGIETAHDLQKEALKLTKDLQDESLMNNIYVRLAGMHGLKDQFDSSRYFLNKAFPFISANNDLALITRYYLTYMNYYYEIDEVDSAKYKLEEGIDYLAGQDDPEKLAQLLVSYGLLLEKRKKDYKAAILPLLRAKALYDSTENLINRRYIYINESLAACYENLEDFESAYKHAQLAYESYYLMTKKNNNELTRTLETKYQTEKKEQEIALLSAQNELAQQEKRNQLYLLSTIVFVALVGAIFIYLQYLNRKKTAAKLQELDSAKSNFFANISHELRTPLTLIKGPIDAQLSKPELDNDSQRNLEMVRRNADRLLELVNQLLDLSKLESGNMKLHVAQGKVLNHIKAIASSFYYAAEQKDISFTIEVLPDTVDTWYDKDAVDKITVNLLSNAVKYTPSKGEVKLTATVEAGHLKLIVCNSGGGIKKEDLQRVLERFYQSDVSNEGAGIGLALVNELIKIHKGELSVKSVEEEYTIFEVTLPVAREAYRPEEERSLTASDVKSPASLVASAKEKGNDFNTINEGKPLLLIVEDNPDLRRLVINLFKQDYQILEAQNGEQGIAMAIEHVPDIIISDVMMPVKDGIALCQELKVDERTSHIPIILLTAKAGDENTIVGLETGADDYMVKPFNQQVLKVKVEKLIELRASLRARYSQELILKPKELAITTADEKFLNRVENILDNKLTASDFTADVFSKEIGMSRMQLHRKLKALIGLSTSEFIRSQRLKMASQLLQKPGINMSEVAYTVGFNDPSYFSKCFKEAYGFSPSEYAEDKSLH